MNLTAGNTPVALAAALSRASGSAVAAALIEADIAAGAPANPDGTLNLIVYAAWLLKQTRDET